MLTKKQEKRRRLIQSTLGYAVTSLGRPLGIPLAASLLFPCTARAEPVTVCIAIATAVVGMAARETDGGIGAKLNASLDYQRTMASQLASLQAAMAQVLTRLSQLTMDLQKAITKESVTAIHARVSVAIDAYSEAVKKSSAFKSYQEWQSNDEVRQELLKIRDQLDDAIRTITARQWLDSLTAVYFVSAIFTNLSVSSILETERPQIVRIKGQEYLSKLAYFDNPGTRGSIASSLNEHSSNCESIIDDLLYDYSYILPANESPEMREILLGEVVIQDFTPASDMPKWGNNPVSDRIGDSEKFEYTTNLTQSYILSDSLPNVPTVSIRQLTLDSSFYARPAAECKPPCFRFPKLPRFHVLIAKGEDAPDNGVYKVDARTPQDRRSAAHKGPYYNQAEQSFKRLEELVQQINYSMAQVALCGAGLVVVTSARRGLYRFFGVAI